jgi:hypothetical protein
MRRTWPIHLLLVGLFLLTSASPVAARPARQSPYVGQIISPQPNSEPLRGSVEIVGIATHPNFWKYDLYALTGRAEDEWISIATGVEQKVESPSRLAVWDTTQVRDDEYILLLRVWDRDGGLQDFQFLRYAVLNARPPDTPTPEATPTQPLPTVPPQTPTVLIEQPPTATPPPSPTPGGPPTATPTSGPSPLSTLSTGSWRDAFCNGAWLTAALFALWGIVWILRQGVRWVLKRQRKEQFLPPG